MAIKKFMEVTVDQIFKLTNAQGAVSEYKKIAEERISCCQAINAELLADPKQRIQVLPLIEVEVKD
jgi:hypothetical protein